MTATEINQTTRQPQRAALPALWAGLVMSVLTVLAVHVDRSTVDVLGGHIQAGYPSYSAAEVDAAAGLWVTYLTVLGGLAVISWSVTIAAVRTGRRWARGAATLVFLAAGAIAITNLLIKDTSGEVGLAPLHGWLGVLPCVAGLTAVILLWRSGPDRA